MMITKICHIIADFFIKEKIISEEQRDVYEYGLTGLVINFGTH